MELSGNSHLDLQTLLIWFTGVVVFVILIAFALIRFFIQEKYTSLVSTIALVNEMHSWYTQKKRSDDQIDSRLDKIEIEFAVFKAEQRTERECYLADFRHIRDNIDTKLAPISKLLMETQDFIEKVDNRLDKAIL